LFIWSLCLSVYMVVNDSVISVGVFAYKEIMAAERCREDHHMDIVSQTMDLDQVLVSIRCRVLVIRECSMDLVAMGRTCMMDLVLPIQHRSVAFFSVDS